MRTCPIHRIPSLFLIAGLVAASAATAQEVPTRVRVHVVARDAKLIGTAVGGARVRIRDADTGEVLSEGLHEGGTGDTGRIMGSRERGGDVFTTSGAAGYSAELPLRAPRRITIEAQGPLGYPQALTRAETSLTVVPGGHLEGDGVVLELWGYIVEILAPDSRTAGVAPDLAVEARVRLLCSCPTEPGGLWEAPDVIARLLDDDGREVARAALRYAGDDSRYEGSLAAADGVYTLEVVATSSRTGNAGTDRRRLQVR